MSRETIQLDDFLKDFVGAFEIETDALTPEKRTKYVCSKCGRSYPEGTNFCSEDGAKIKEEVYEVRSEGYKELVSEAISRFEDYTGDKKGLEKFSYEYIDTIDKKAEDASGWWYLYVFKRKSDGKYFYYGMYEGRVEEYTIDECNKKEVIVWDFESMFA